VSLNFVINIGGKNDMRLCNLENFLPDLDGKFAGPITAVCHTNERVPFLKQLKTPEE
jgi:hypothetical protein